MTFVLLLVELSAALVAATLLGALALWGTGMSGTPATAAVAVAVAVVLLVLPLFMAARLIRAFPKAAPARISLGSMLVVALIGAGVPVGAFPHAAGVALSTHGDWAVPAAAPPAVRDGVHQLTATAAGLLGAASAEPTPEAEPEPAPVSEVKPEPMTARELFRERVDAVVLVEVRREVADDSVLGKLASMLGTKTVRGHGSGFFVSDDGLFVTNDHVLGDVDAARVVLHDGRHFEAVEILVRDRANDLVLAKVPTASQPHVQLSEAPPEIGAPAYAIGSPLGMDFTLTQGIVSAMRADGDTKFIQMQTDIAPGSSGGPLFDEFGRVAGVATAVQRAAGLNLAVDASHVRDLLAAERHAELLAPYADTEMMVVGVEFAGADINPVDRMNLRSMADLLGNLASGCSSELPANGHVIVELDEFKVTSNLGDAADACLGGRFDMARIPLRFALVDGGPTTEPLQVLVHLKQGDAKALDMDLRVHGWEP